MLSSSQSGPRDTKQSVPSTLVTPCKHVIRVHNHRTGGEHTSHNHRSLTYLQARTSNTLQSQRLTSSRTFTPSALTRL
jgi:hypothetical protein